MHVLIHLNNKKSTPTETLIQVIIYQWENWQNALKTASCIKNVTFLTNCINVQWGSNTECTKIYVYKRFINLIGFERVYVFSMLAHFILHLLTLYSTAAIMLSSVLFCSVATHRQSNKKHLKNQHA